MKTRIITAIILIVSVIWAIFFAPAIVFDIFLALFLGVAGWEWIGLTPFSQEHAKKSHIIYRVLFIILIEALWLGFSMWTVGFEGLLYFNAVLILLLVPALLTYPKTVSLWHSCSSVIILGISFLVTAGVALGHLKQIPEGNKWLMVTLLLTWMADTAAYFAGRFLGKRKFIPLVSPNKTWEGFWGGLLLSEVIVIGFGVQFAADTLGWTTWIIAGTLAILGSIVGDLFISMLKRCVQVKDTGSLLPGHGGILDRVDSLLVSSAIIALFLIGGR